MQSPSDGELVDQAKRSQRAFGEIVQRHQAAVYSLCYRMTGSASEAEDLAQESFLRLYRSLDRLRAGAPLRPWLTKVAANVCLDALRRRKAATVRLDDALDVGAEPRAEQREEPEEALLRRETRRSVQEGLRLLPDDYRAVLVLRYLEDLSYQEIAEALGVPTSTVETRLFRAKKMLGRILAPLASGTAGEG